MGYDLHITRREDWPDKEAPGISLEEWLAYVATDKELELTGAYQIPLGSKTYFQESPGYCNWHAHPTDKGPEALPWFSYDEGNVSTKNPDTATIRKMMQIAAALNARIQGDDGEIYTEQYLAELEASEGG